MKRINFHPYLLITLVAFFLAWLTGCSTPEKLVTKAYKKDPVYVADWTRTKFPCVTGDSVVTMQTDTVYDFIELECPEYFIMPLQGDSFKIHAEVKPKTLTTGRFIPTKFSIPRPVQTITITKKVEDSAKIFLMQNAVAKCDNLNKELTIKLKRSQKFNMWMVIALLLAGGVIYLLSRKR
jgi:hypothetical protein